MRQRAVADIPESVLSDIRHHPPPRPPDGRLKRNKIKKPPLAVKKPNSGPIPTFPKGKEIDNHAIGHGDIDSCKITTSAKCNGLQQDNCQKCVGGNYKIKYSACGHSQHSPRCHPLLIIVCRYGFLSENICWH